MDSEWSKVSSFVRKADPEAETVWTVRGQKYRHLYERRIPRLRRYGQCVVKSIVICTKGGSRG